MSDTGYFSVLSYCNLLKQTYSNLYKIVKYYFNNSKILLLQNKLTFTFLAERSNYNHLAITDTTDYLIK